MAVDVAKLVLKRLDELGRLPPGCCCSSPEADVQSSALMMMLRRPPPQVQLPFFLVC